MLRILLVDDEPLVLIGLQGMLEWEKLGYTVCGTARNGKLALEMIEREKPDIGRQTGGFGREIPRFGNISGKISESITVARPPTPSCRAACPPAGHCPNLGNRRLPALGARAARRREARRSGLQKTAGMAIPPDRERGIPWNAEHPRGCPEASQAHGQA